MPSYVRPGIRKCAKNRALSKEGKPIMNSYTSNPDEAENSTGKSMKKNIPGLALLLLDLAVALVGFLSLIHI